MTTLQQQAAELVVQIAMCDSCSEYQNSAEQAAALLRQFAELGKGEGLTDEQIDLLADEFLDDECRICESYVHEFARAIEYAASIRKGGLL